MWKTFKTAALLLIVCLFTNTQAYAQINLSYGNAPAKQVIESIKNQTNYSFIYQSTVFNDSDRVTIRVRNATLQQSLDLLKKQLPIDYVVVNNIVTIIRTMARIDVPQPPPPAPVVYLRGTVLNEQNEPLYGATVYVKRLPLSVATNIEGKFSLPNVKSADTLVFTNVGYEKMEIVSDGNMKLSVKMVARANDLMDVSITTGISREQQRRTTGAFSVVDGRTYNRSAGVNVIDRLEGVTPSLLFNKNIVAGLNQSEISIRGRSTIYANAEPLIVLDNFPYTGPLSSVNPNDVEKITVLKDPASAGIWGAYSGNGVIVITTKKGKYDQPLKTSFVANLTYAGKPDLYYAPFMNSRSKIELEEFLFNKGYYRFFENNLARPVLSPVIELLIKKRDGKIGETEANAQLEKLRNTDIRKEVERLFYENTLLQQYGINLRGGATNNHYYFSAGMDKQPAGTLNNNFTRLTLNGNNTFLVLNKRLEINTGLMFTYSRQNANPRLFDGMLYPYMELQDEKGNATTIPAGIRQAYKDTAGAGTLLDWNFRPLDEARMSDYKQDINSFRVDLGLKYKVAKGLEAKLLYQFVKDISEVNDYKSQATYFARNLINLYTQIGSRGEIIRPVPLGGMLDMINSTSNTHNLRGQLQYAKAFGDHEFSTIAGVDIRSSKARQSASRLYGYNKETQSSTQVDLVNDYPLYHYPFLESRVPYPFEFANKKTTANFYSAFANVLYSYNRTYNVSLSIRKDESNLFGVKANQKGVPLWTAGFSWNLSNEKFYNVAWLPDLKLRIANGYSGNVDQTVSAYTVAQRDGQNSYGNPTASITNPPNPSLRWERSYMFNAGVDFGFEEGKISGSIDYFFRRAKDLIGLSPIDPTTGVEIFKGNSGAMKGQGLDLLLNAKILKGKFNWTTNLLASYSLDKVADYKDRKGSIGFYLNGTTLNPLPGNPLYSVYALKWIGLDPANGDPIGYIEGHDSKEYSRIINSTDFNNLINKGSGVPLVFGSLINTFNYKGFELSCIVMYKFGYHFRRSSVEYFDLVAGQAFGHPDFDKRWKTQGDELRTTVPSFQYPTDFNRDDFYNASEVLIESGDHIRLKDLRLGYLFNRPQKGSFPAIRAEVFVHVNNIGLIWKANKQGIDPDFINTPPAVRSYTLGMKLDL